ncbi:MAG: hypothetical protein R3F61_35970 [Myxococcota bacterium]
MSRQRSVSDADWNQLITLASGYLALESGDIQGAMRRALAAHMDLIAALKAEQISVEVDEGRVTMFVPDSGGVALRLSGGPGRDAMDVPLTRPPPLPHESTEAPTEIDAQPHFVVPEGLADAPTERSGKHSHEDD